MKSQFSFGIVVLLFIVNWNASKAQNDSTSIEITEEISALKDYNFKQKYDYLNINLKEEKTVLKLGMPTQQLINIGDYLQFSHFEIYPGIETKLSPSVSIYLGLAYLFINQYHTSGWDATVNSLKIDIESRYYINMKNRIDRGIHANNISGSYVSLRYCPPNINLAKDVFDVEHEIVTGTIGYQKRLTNLIYMDAQAYASYHNDKTFKAGFLVYFGFGWGL